MKSTLKICLSMFVLLCSFAYADLIYVDINMLSENAYDIVEGEVINKEQKWDKERRYIYTYTTIKVEKSLKGITKSGEITLKEIGGKLDGFTTSAEGQTNYYSGEEVLVFIQKNEEHYRTFGLCLGKFNIFTENNIKYEERDIESCDKE